MDLRITSFHGKAITKKDETIRFQERNYSVLEAGIICTQVFRVTM
jgi:hypothetical protein